MLHTSVVPTILTAGYRYNVIPSEAKATLDVRLHPDEDQATFLDQIRAVIKDPASRSAGRASATARRARHG